MITMFSRAIGRGVLARLVGLRVPPRERVDAQRGAPSTAAATTTAMSVAMANEHRVPARLGASYLSADALGLRPRAAPACPCARCASSLRQPEPSSAGVASSMPGIVRLCGPRVVCLDERDGDSGAGGASFASTSTGMSVGTTPSVCSLLLATRLPESPNSEGRP